VCKLSEARARKRTGHIIAAITPVPGSKNIKKIPAATIIPKIGKIFFAGL